MILDGESIHQTDRRGEPSTAYSSLPFRDLVARYTTEGGENVDYAAWKDSPDDLKALDRQIEMIAQISPASHPELCPP